MVKSSTGSSEILPPYNLRAALNDLDIQVTDEEAAALYVEFDTDNAEGLDLDEFALMVKRPRRLDEWARSLPLAEIVADSLPRKLGLDPLRVLSSMTSDDLSASLEALHHGFQRMLKQAHAELQAAFQVNDARQNLGSGDGGSKFSVIAMSCGNHLDSCHLRCRTSRTMSYVMHVRHCTCDVRHRVEHRTYDVVRAIYRM